MCKAQFFILLQTVQFPPNFECFKFGNEAYIPRCSNQSRGLIPTIISCSNHQSSWKGQFLFHEICSVKPPLEQLVKCLLDRHWLTMNNSERFIKKLGFSTPTISKLIGVIHFQCQERTNNQWTRPIKIWLMKYFASVFNVVIVVFVCLFKEREGSVLLEGIVWSFMWKSIHGSIIHSLFISVASISHWSATRL